MAELATKFYIALKSVPAFPTATYVEQLQYHSRNVGDLGFMSGNLPEVPSEKVLKGRHLSSGNASTLINTLAQASTAYSVGQLNQFQDPFGFRTCIDQRTSELVLVDSLTRLLGYCYADHLDENLGDQDFPSLQDLQNNEDFIRAFREKIMDQETIYEEVEQDYTNTAFSANVLFAANYFAHQATPKIHESSQIWAQDFATFIIIRIKAAVDSDLSGPNDVTRALLKLLVQTMPVAYGMRNSDHPNPYLRPPRSGEVSQPLAGIPMSEGVKKAIDEITAQGFQLGDWKSWGEILVSLWNTVKSKYEEAVGLHAIAQTAHYEDGPILTSEVPATTTITTIVGDNIKNWIARNRSSYPEMVTRDPPRNWAVSYSNPMASCFVAGTKIITKHGTKNIEDLIENDWVLTRGEFDEWGLVSDEKVAVAVDAPLIHGFNDDEPFFTAGHIFLTATGPRALDPVLAMKENPWTDVGRLAVGHSLLRLNQQTKTYDQVFIRSISSQKMAHIDKVYGVHLREGRRSYHANGYMVAVNYPEITMKSICKMLRTVPVDKQARMLLAFNELKPLFEKFGIGGVSDVLQKEIEAECDKNSMRLYKTHKTKLVGPGNFSLEFAPEYISGVDYSVLPGPLPTVSVLEGVVFVNGIACERASINNSSHEIRWVRQISVSPSVFEHGTLQVDPVMKGAQGDLAYTEDASGKVLLLDNHIPFLSLGADADQLPSYSETDAAPAYSIAAATVTKSKPPRGGEQVKIAVSSKSRKSSRVASTSFALDDTMTTSIQSVDEDTTAEKEDPLFLPEANVKVLLRPIEFNMIYDDSKWKSDVVNPRDPTPFGRLQLALGRKNVDGLPGRVALLPDLDKLVDQINDKHVDSSLGTLRSLYDSSLSTDAQGRVVVACRMTPNAHELLRALQDEKDNNDEGSLKVTFKKQLESNVTLGMLFSSFELTLGPDEKTATGIIWEYSADTTTGEGAKHLFISNPGDLSKRVDIEKRLEGSKRAADISTGTPTTPISTPQNPPPTPPRAGPSGPYTVNTIEAIKYSTADMEMKSRKMLEDMMYFHMNKDDLNKIFNKNTPTLPDHLGNNLAGDLKKWITDVYAPAFTALQITESFNVKDWQSKFTDKEKRKILYFWQGDGPKCLSNSSEYKRINQLCTREAMLQLYPALNQFIADGGPNWAKKYYDEIVAMRLDDVVEKAAVNDQQPLQKYCNILYCLDPDTLYSSKFWQEVTEKVAAILMLQPQNLDPDNPAPWLVDATNWLTEALLNPDDKRLDSKTRAALLKDFEDYAKQQGQEFDRTNKAAAASAINQHIRQILSIPKAFGAMSIVAKGLWYRSTSVMKNELWLKANDMSKVGGKLMTFLKVLTLAGNVFLLIFKKDVEMTPSERAKMGATIAQNVMDILGPHLAKTGPRTAAQVQAETALLTDKARKTPFGFRQGKLIDQKVKYLQKVGEEAMQMDGTVTRGQKGFFGRLKDKVGMPVRYLRMLAVAISLAYIGFLIWDLVTRAGAMSATQLALNILNIVLEVAIVIVEVLGLIFSAVSCIPVIGQILVIGVLIVGIFMMIFGNTEHQKTPGEVFVEKMQKDWLPKLDDPPSTLLTVKSVPTGAPKGSQVNLSVVLTNLTNNDIKFVNATTKLGGKEPSKDTIDSTSLWFFSGTDESNLLTNAAFTGPGQASQSGAGTWDVTVPPSSEKSKWNITLVSPNGTSTRSTAYQIQIRAADKQEPIIKRGEEITFNLSGQLVNVEGTTSIKITESRVGAPFAVNPYEFRRTN